MNQSGKMSSSHLVAAALIGLLLASCGSGGGNGGRDNYTIQVNAFGATLGPGSAALTVTDQVSGTSATFSGTSASVTLNYLYAAAASYNLVLSNPTLPAQTCTPTASSAPLTGTISGNVTIDLTCTVVTVDVKGTVTGLTGQGLTLQFQNGTPGTASVAPSAGAGFDFTVPSGSTYSVSVASQPSNPTQKCTPQVSTNKTGTADPSDNPVLQVSCKPTPFTVSGTVQNLQSAGLVLQDGAGDTLSVSPQQPTFTFTLNSGTAFAITQSTAPAGPPQQTCGPSSPGSTSGTVTDQNVQGVLITCTTNAYPVSFTLAGTSGQGLQLSLYVNGALFSSLLVNQNRSTNNPYTFPQSAPSGSKYSVVVSEQNDISQNCYVWNVGGSGTIGNQAPPLATVVCQNVPRYALATGFTFNTTTNTGSYDVFYYGLQDPTLRVGALSAYTNNPIAVVSDANAFASFLVPAPGEGVDFVMEPNSTAMTTTVTDYAGGSEPPFNSPPFYPFVINPVTIPGFVGNNGAKFANAAANSQLVVCYQQGTTVSLQAYDLFLSAIGGPVTVATGVSPNAHCAIYLAGQFFYVNIVDFVNQTNSLYGFSYGNGNTAPAIAPAPVPGNPLQLSMQEVNGILIEPQSRFLYTIQDIVANSSNCPHGGYSLISTSLKPYVIGPQGGVSSGGATSFTISPQDGCYAPDLTNSTFFEPSGTLAYVLYSTQIHILTIDPSSGGLNDMKDWPTGPLQGASAIDPSGKFIFANNGGKLLTYTVDPSTLSLFELPPSDAARGSYGPPTVDPSGQFLYLNTFSCTNNTCANIFNAYTFDPVNGIKPNGNSNQVPPVNTYINSGTLIVQ